MRLTEDSVLCIARRHGDSDFETLGCLGLQYPELALMFGDTAELLEGKGNVFTLQLLDLEYDAPSMWPEEACASFMPWPDAREVLVKMIKDYNNGFSAKA